MRRIFLMLAAATCSTAALAASPKQVVLQVRNMTCPACSITIGKALDQVPGVSARRVDTHAETVTVAFDAERTTEATIAKAVSEAGFPAVVKAAKP